MTSPKKWRRLSVCLEKFPTVGGGKKKRCKNKLDPIFFEKFSQSSQVRKRGGVKIPHIVPKFTKFPTSTGGGSAEVGNFSQVFPVFNFEGLPYLFYLFCFISHTSKWCTNYKFTVACGRKNWEAQGKNSPPLMPISFRLCRCGEWNLQYYCG